MTNAFLTVVNFAGRHPRAYLGSSFAIGLGVRLWWAHGDLGLFINPLFPILTR
jgi:hypothetical protein